MSEEPDWESDEDHIARFKKWGFAAKSNQDHTILDTIHDLKRLFDLHPNMLKGVVVVCIYDHLESQEHSKKYDSTETIDIPPSPNYLMTGGMSVVEVVGSLQIASRRIDEQAS